MCFNHVSVDNKFAGEETCTNNFENAASSKAHHNVSNAFLPFLSNYLERNKICIFIKFTFASNSPSDREY